MTTEFVNRLEKVIRETEINAIPVTIPKAETQVVVTGDLIAGMRLKVESELNRGIFDWQYATQAEIVIAEEITERKRKEKANIAFQKAGEQFLKEDLDKQRRSVEDTKGNVAILKRRVPFFIATETHNERFDRVNLKVGRYDFYFQGDKIEKVINARSALPLVGKAQGKEFVIRNIRRSLINGKETLVVSVDLNQNIIPLLLVTGAVGSILLGGTAFVLHKTERILSAPLLWVAVVGFILLIFFGKLKV